MAPRLQNAGGILQERQGSTWTAAYTYGSALLRRNTEVPLYDALGSERTVTDGSGAVTGSIACEAFGQAVATSGSSASPYTFAATSGYRNDGDAGLTHVGARYYDAQAGRFITRDTELDQHPYLYCGHDPVNALDPSGHIPYFGQITELHPCNWGQVGWNYLGRMVKAGWEGAIVGAVIGGVVGVVGGGIGGALLSGPGAPIGAGGGAVVGGGGGVVGGAISGFIGGVASVPILDAYHWVCDKGWNWMKRVF